MSAEEEEGLALERWGTRFALAATEARYRVFQLERAAPFFRVALLSATVLWTLFGVVLLAARVIGADGWSAAVFGVMVPGNALGLWVARRAASLPSVPIIVAALNTLAGVVGVLLVTQHLGLVDASMTAAAVAAYTGFTVLRLRPGLAMAATAPYLVLDAAYGVAALQAGAFTASHLAVYVFGLGAIAYTGFSACIALDVVTRQAFVQTQIIERQRATIARERERSESLLKAEVSHQVAARSRELGQMLAKIDATFVVGKLGLGERFDTRYRVERELGAGGMGAVYEVERLTDQQRLALKIVTGEVSGASAARFAREAEIGAGVRHPNVISIVDVGIAEGVPFLAMELAPQGSLEERRAKFGDPAWALPILHEVAAGLSALHEAGVVHRDLKPANVLFVDGDVAKISDFGISRFGALEVGPDVDPNAATVGATPSVKPGSTPAARGPGLTATGVLLGTPYYMAPEAARGGRTVDAPADVFAFGILACEMLTGRTPFATPPVFLAMSGQPLPSIALGTTVPDDVRALLTACLAEDPTQRPTMRAVGAALAGERR